MHLQPDETGHHYMLSLVATDRVGLLYSVAQVLVRHGANVLTAKILTLGERVEDVFSRGSGAGTAARAVAARDGSAPGVGPAIGLQSGSRRPVLASCSQASTNQCLFLGGHARTVTSRWACPPVASLVHPLAAS